MRRVRGRGFGPALVASAGTPASCALRGQSRTGNAIDLPAQPRYGIWGQMWARRSGVVSAIEGAFCSRWCCCTDVGSRVRGGCVQPSSQCTCPPARINACRGTAVTRTQHPW
jgi:hypothetical protein